MRLLTPSSLRFSWHILLLVHLSVILTTTVSTPTPRLQQDLPTGPLIARTTLPLLPLLAPRTRPLPPNKPPQLTIHTLHHIARPERENPRIPVKLINILERLYDSLATFVLFHYYDGIDFLDAQDLTLRIGALRLNLHTEAELLSREAVKEVVRRLGQLAQRGLTGLVMGEVRDVGAAVGVVFTLGIVGL